MALTSIDGTRGTANFIMRTPSGASHGGNGTSVQNFNCLFQNFQYSNSVASNDVTTFCEAGTIAEEQGIEVLAISFQGVLKKGTGGASSLANGIPFLSISDWDRVPCTLVLDTGCTIAGTFNFFLSSGALGVNQIGGFAISGRNNGDFTVTWDTTS